MRTDARTVQIVRSARRVHPRVRVSSILVTVAMFTVTPAYAMAGTPIGNESLVGSTAAAEGTVSLENRKITWQGPQFTAAINTSQSTRGCVDDQGRPLSSSTTTGPDACDLFTLTVAGGPHLWDDRAGGVVVRVAGGPVDDFDLYVHKRNDDGTLGPLVDSSAGEAGVTETAVVDAASGDYYVLVIGFAVAAASYSGSAELVLEELEVHRTGRSVSSYLHDVSEPDPNITVPDSGVEQHRIPVGDGVEIDTWVFRPDPAKESEPVPVVLTVTPYYGGGNPIDSALRPLADELVPRGYAYGIVSVRGTGNSGGCFTIGGPSEAADTAAVIEYYGRLPWSSGKVGLVGLSYDGTTAQDVWVQAPPSLKTIVPVAPISDLYKYNFVNAVPAVPQGYAFNTYYWADTGLSSTGLHGGDQLRDPVNVPGAVAGEVCPEQVWVQEGGASSAADGNKDGYWQQRDFLAELRARPDEPRASVFYIHGLADWNVKPHHMEDWLTAVQATGVPFKAWLGQWAHAFADRDDAGKALIAWLDQFLKNRDTGILDAPAVQIETDVKGFGKWRHETHWPPAKAKQMVLHPHTDESLRPTPGTGNASYYDYRGRLPSAVEQTLHGSGRVMFVSEPFTKDRHITGLPEFDGVITASGHRASLMLTLLEIRPDGTRRSLNYAAFSLNHVTDLANGRQSIAALPQRVRVNFFPQDDLVRAGSRVALVAAGNIVIENTTGPQLQPIADGSTITMDLARTRLTLAYDNTITTEKP